MGKNQSVSIAIGKNEKNYFDVTIHRNQIKNGAVIVRQWTKNYNPNTEWKIKIIEAEASIEGVRYLFLHKDDLHFYFDLIFLVRHLAYALQWLYHLKVWQLLDMS